MPSTYRQKVFSGISLYCESLTPFAGDKRASFSLEPVTRLENNPNADTPMHWKSEIGKGHCRTGSSSDREAFTVLYEMKECAKNGLLETILSWSWS